MQKNFTVHRRDGTTGWKNFSVSGKNQTKHPAAGIYRDGTVFAFLLFRGRYSAKRRRQPMRRNNSCFPDCYTVDFSQTAERRGFDRLLCHLLVDYTVADLAYRDFIRDIGCDGMFIQTRRKFGVGLRILIVLSALGLGSIKASGKIIRMSREGIGVKFDTPLFEAQLKSLLLSWT
jgi:Tfp pilus assembly protein PilZ